jgi:hypothetical protein
MPKTKEPVYNLELTVRYRVDGAFTHRDLHRFSTDKDAVSWLLDQDSLPDLATETEILHTAVTIDNFRKLNERNKDAKRKEIS